MDEKTIARFWSHVDKMGPVPSHVPELGPCWVWTGPRIKYGYGRFGFGGARHLSHRVAFLLERGRWPEPNACHRCDNTSCVRIDHLFEGSHTDNMRDMFAKGRRVHARGEQLSRLTEENVLAIRRELANGVAHSELLERYPVSQPTLSSIAARRTWKHLDGAAIPSRMRDSYQLSRRLRAGDAGAFAQVMSTIKACNGRFADTAAALEISTTTLWQWQRRFSEIRRAFLDNEPAGRKGRPRNR